MKYRETEFQNNKCQALVRKQQLGKDWFLIDLEVNAFDSQNALSFHSGEYSELGTNELFFEKRMFVGPADESWFS